MTSPSEIGGEPCSSSTSLIEQFRCVATAYPASPAIICTHQPGDLYGLGDINADSAPYLQWTYKTLDQVVQRFSANLSRCNLHPGIPFFLICQNRAEYIAGTLAAYSLGLLHVPLNPDLLYQTDDIQYMVDRVLERGEHDAAVVMASASEIASHVDQLQLPPNNVKIALDGFKEGWVPFSNLLVENNTISISPPGEERMVNFTSGTTSRPKGCLIRADRWFNALGECMMWKDLSPGEKVAVPLPNSHAWGQINIFLPLLKGGCLVFAGYKFDPPALAEAIVREQCANLALVPTMVYSLRDILSKADTRCIKGIAFAGMVLTPAVVKMCKDHFGVSQIENLYGMTEGGFITTGPVQDLSKLQKNHDVTVCKPIPGCRVRLYSADGHAIAPRGTPGQMHVAGDSLISGYFTGSNEQFYELEGRVWFNTGDLAILDHDNRIFIIGRDKEVIVRGGENISPAKIESVFSQVPELAGLDIQVVGKSSDIAGELPVAVTKQEISHEKVRLLRSSVRTVLGSMYVPAEVISLTSLKLDDFPRTSSGKVRKEGLAKIASSNSPSQTHKKQQAPTREKITAAWAAVLGINQSQVDVDAPLTHLADSITMLIVRDRLRKENRFEVPLESWNNVSTIAEQIQRVEQFDQDERGSQSTPATSCSRSWLSSPDPSPPQVDDMVHLGGDARGFPETKAAIQEALIPFSLSWNDVTEVIPCTDFIQLISKPRIVDTWNIRTTVLSEGASKASMRSALESILCINPILLSFVVVDPARLGASLGLYVLIKQSRETLDRCIIDCGEVQGMEDVKRTAMIYPFKDHAKLPGPLFRALILYVQEMKSAVAITNSMFFSMMIRAIRMLFIKFWTASNINSQPLCSGQDFPHVSSRGS